MMVAVQLFEHDGQPSRGRAPQGLAEHKHRRMALPDLRKNAPRGLRFAVNGGACSPAVLVEIGERGSNGDGRRSSASARCGKKLELRQMQVPIVLPPRTA